MFNYKSKRQALVTSVLITLLCFTCLTGATLALFTSDPSDGTIGIVTTSGDLEIDIVDTYGVTLQNRALEFIVSSDEQYFDE